ncbi:AIDA repeat-containing protein [Pantoea stewartii]|uniref:AIDA repeat-containing protein n=1 Tax=Pantoea stewartii TaxID=66269 RepID=UPI00198208A5|nr:AIDA repeat-containing protein [Pantoea stewartii]
MNKVYRIIWSVARQAWIVTSEHAGYGGSVPLLAATLMLSVVSENAAAASHNNETIGDTQSQNILNGDTATATTINNGGNQFISSGGLATSTIVNSGGVQYVSSGGFATSSLVRSGGFQTILNSGMATGTMVNGGTQTVRDGGSASNILVNSGTQTIQNGGSVISTTVNSSGGQYISSGGSATSTTLNSGGLQYVSSGGSATNTIVNSGGIQTVLGGGMVTEVLVNGGTQFLQDGSTVTSATINASGFQTVMSGALAMSTLVNGGTQTIMNGGSASNILVNSGTQTIQDGGKVTSTTVNASGGQYISSGGSATSTLINAGGSQYVSSGGAAAFTLLNTSSFQTVLGGGTATGTRVNGGMQTVQDGGSVTSTTVTSGGTQTVFNNGVATDTILNSGTQTIRNGGSAISTTLNTGTQTIQTGGTVTLTTLNAYAGQYVSKGGTAISTIVNSTGNQYVNSGGNAISSFVNSGGFLTVSGGGTAAFTLVNSGGFEVVSGGGLASDTSVNSGGILSVSSGGILAGTTTLNDGALLSGNSIINNGNMNFVLQNTSAWNGDLAGNGQVTKNGSGALSLGGTLKQSQINLNAGSLVMDGLEATTSIIAQSGTSLSLVNNSILNGIIDPTDVSIDQSSTWNMTGDSLVNTLTNAGKIVFIPTSGAFTPHTLTVTNFIGNGGLLTLNTVAGDTNSLVDHVIIDGGNASGTTGLLIVNRGGLGAQTTGNGIAVIQALNGATTDKNAFIMKQPLTAGAYAYSLYRNVNQSWYLTSQQVRSDDIANDSNSPESNDGTLQSTSEVPNYRDAVWVYASMPTLSLDYDRMVAGTADTRFHYAPSSRIWGRLAAGHLRHSNSGNLTDGNVPESSSAYCFVQIGGDLWQLDGENAEWRAGIYAATGLMRNEVWTDNNNLAAGLARDTLYAGGGYVSGVTYSGLHIEGLLQTSYHRFSTSSNDATRLSTAGTGWLASTEIGQTVDITSRLAIEPQLQYIIQGLNIDQGQDQAASINWHTPHRQSIRAGVKIGSSSDTESTFSWWLTPSLTQSYGGHSQMAISVPNVEDSQTMFRSNLSGTSLGLNDGISARVRNNVTLNLQSGWSESLHGGESGGYYGLVNLVVSFH